ncbi:hypothetical protein E0I07_27270 [Escherichia coli]|nr:hypothetical protein E0I07_27270 [Escherichia coli]
MLGGADNPNGELPSYITGADTAAPVVRNGTDPAWHASATRPGDGIFLTRGIMADGLHISR